MFSEKKSFIYVLLFIAIAFSALFVYNKQPYTEGTFWQVSKDARQTLLYFKSNGHTLSSPYIYVNF